MYSELLFSHRTDDHGIQTSVTDFCKTLCVGLPPEDYLETAQGLDTECKLNLGKVSGLATYLLLGYIQGVG